MPKDFLWYNSKFSGFLREQEKIFHTYSGPYRPQSFYLKFIARLNNVSKNGPSFYYNFLRECSFLSKNLNISGYCMQKNITQFTLMDSDTRRRQTQLI